MAVILLLHRVRRGMGVRRMREVSRTRSGLGLWGIGRVDKERGLDGVEPSREYFEICSIVGSISLELDREG